jgi:hypothetical protein
MSSQRVFTFEEQWLLEPEFMRIFEGNWKKIVGRCHDKSYSMDVWHGCLSLTRQYLREWNANKVRENSKLRLKLPKD